MCFHVRPKLMSLTISTFYSNVYPRSFSLQSVFEKYPLMPDLPPKVTMSAGVLKFQCSWAHIFPVEPTPVLVSSTMKGIYDYRAISLSFLQKQGVAILFSYALIGSTIIAPTNCFASLLLLIIFLTSSRHLSSSALFSCSN